MDLNDDGWMLEITPDGRLMCQTGMAMDDIQSVLSDGTPEDLGTDELAKQAKYYLQPAVNKVRKSFVDAGFQERTEMNDEYVAVIFERPVDIEDTDTVARTIAWCRRQLAAVPSGR